MLRLLGLLTAVLFMLPIQGFSGESAKTSSKFPFFVKRAFGYASLIVGGETNYSTKEGVIPLLAREKPTNMTFDEATSSFIITSAGTYKVKYFLSAPQDTTLIFGVRDISSNEDLSLPPPSTLAETSLLSSPSCSTGEIMKKFKKGSQIQLYVQEGEAVWTNTVDQIPLVVSYLSIEKVSK